MIESNVVLFLSHRSICSVFFLGDELKQTVSIVVDLASVFDPDGVDVYFLNREPVFHVRNSQQLIPVFAVPPSGKHCQPSNNNLTGILSLSLSIQ